MKNFVINDRSNGDASSALPNKLLNVGDDVTMFKPDSSTSASVLMSL